MKSQGLLILFIFTISCASGTTIVPSPPVTTVSPTTAGTISPTTTPLIVTLPAHAMLVDDYIRKSLAENKIKLLDIESKLATKQLSIFIEPMDKTHTPEAAATLALGLMVKAIALADASTRPTLVRVLYVTSQQKIRRITMTEPTLSQFLTGIITDAEAIATVKIEEEQ